MSLGVLDLRVVVGYLGKDRVLQPRRWCSATAAPVVGRWQRAASSIGNVACGVSLDASAEACLPFVRGHGWMFGNFFEIAMPKISRLRHQHQIVRLAQIFSSPKGADVRVMRQLFESLDCCCAGQRHDVIEVPFGFVIPAHAVSELAFNVLRKLFPTASKRFCSF